MKHSAMIVALVATLVALLAHAGTGSPVLKPRQPGTYWSTSGAYDYVQCVNPRHFALTFDDGPSSLTSRLLATLANKNVKATFFVVGNQVDSFSSNMIAAKNAGHQIAGHTYTHRDLTILSDADVRAEMQRTEQTVQGKIGVVPALMRPPFGNIDNRVKRIVNGLGVKVVVWSFDSNDWRFSSASEVVTSVRNGVPTAGTRGQIGLFHDIHARTVDAMPQVIDILRSKGYTLVTLSDCFGGVSAYKGSTTPPSPPPSPPSPQPVVPPLPSPPSVPPPPPPVVPPPAVPDTGVCPPGCGTGVYWATGRCTNGKCVCWIGWTGPDCRTPGWA